jgi:hypothetical protein
MTGEELIKPRHGAFDVTKKTAYWAAPKSLPDGQPELMLLAELEIKLPDDVETVRIEAEAVGGNENKFSSNATKEGFRGAFISHVKDTSIGDKGAIEYRRFETYDLAIGEQTNACVNINKWDEGKYPMIEFRPSKGANSSLSGTIKIDLLCVFSLSKSVTEFDWGNIRVEVRMQNLIGWKEELLSSLILDFGGEEDLQNCVIDESKIITAYEDHAYNTDGEGYSLHPKQLVTSEHLSEVLSSAGDISTIGYIGLDTGENFHSVLRTINNHPRKKEISKLLVFYQKEWDGAYMKKMGYSIHNNTNLDIKWVDVDKEEPGKNKVNLMISTYVAVWALGPSAIQQANHEKYFKRILDDLEEYGLLLSVDPLSQEKLARSSSSSGQIDVRSWYLSKGFKELDTIKLAPNTSPMCEATLWSKVDGFRIFEGDSESEQNHVHESADSSTSHNIEILQDYLNAITLVGDLIDCAGIPTKASNLSFPQLLNEKSMIKDSNGKPMPIIPNIDDIRAMGETKEIEKTIAIGRTCFDNGRSIQLGQIEGVFTKDMLVIEAKGVKRQSANEIRFQGEFQNKKFTLDVQPKADADADEKVTKSIAQDGGFDWFVELCNEGYFDYSMSLGIQKYWTTLVGKPGSGKSVRLRQVLHKAATILDDSESVGEEGKGWSWNNVERPSSIPILVKAKELAKYLPANDMFWKSALDPEIWRLSNEAVAKAAITSTPLLKGYGIDEEKIIQMIDWADELGHGIHLLIDALDEVTDESSREHVVEWMNWTSTKEKVRRLLISTRPSAKDIIRRSDGCSPESPMFEVEYESEILSKEFAQKLIAEWKMNSALVTKIQEYTKDPEYLKVISNPLLLGWLCRFVRDDRPLPLDPRNFAHEFPKAILDHATFEHIASRRGAIKIDSDYKESVSMIRNLIGFYDLAVNGFINHMKSNYEGLFDGLSWEPSLVEEHGLGNSGVRDAILKLRNNPALVKSKQIRDLGDSDAHRLFFEDLTMLYISDSSNLEWTHQHLKEHAASQFVSSPESVEVLENLADFGIFALENPWAEGPFVKHFERICSIDKGIVPRPPYLDDYFHITCVRYFAEIEQKDALEFMMDMLILSLDEHKDSLYAGWKSDQIRLLFNIYRQYFPMVSDDDWDFNLLTKSMKEKLESIFRQWIEFSNRGLNPIWLATDYHSHGESVQTNYVVPEQQQLGTVPDFSVHWKGGIMTMIEEYVQEFHEPGVESFQKIGDLFESEKDGLKTMEVVQGESPHLWIQDWGFARFIDSFNFYYNEYLHEDDIGFFFDDDGDAAYADGSITDFIDTYAPTELFGERRWKWLLGLNNDVIKPQSADAFERSCAALGLTPLLQSFDDEGEEEELSTIQSAFAKLFDGYLWENGDINDDAWSFDDEILKKSILKGSELKFNKFDFSGSDFLQMDYTSSQKLSLIKKFEENNYFTPKSAKFSQDLQKIGGLNYKYIGGTKELTRKIDEQTAMKQRHSELKTAWEQYRKPEYTSKYYCIPCDTTFENRNSLDEHRKEVRHEAGSKDTLLKYHPDVIAEQLEIMNQMYSNISEFARLDDKFGIDEDILLDFIKILNRIINPKMTYLHYSGQNKHIFDDIFAKTMDLVFSLFSMDKSFRKSEDRYLNGLYLQYFVQVPILILKMEKTMGETDKFNSMLFDDMEINPFLEVILCLSRARLEFALSSPEGLYPNSPMISEVNNATNLLPKFDVLGNQLKIDVEIRIVDLLIRFYSILDPSNSELLELYEKSLKLFDDSEYTRRGEEKVIRNHIEMAAWMLRFQPDSMDSDLVEGKSIREKCAKHIEFSLNSLDLELNLDPKRSILNKMRTKALGLLIDWRLFYTPYSSLDMERSISVQKINSLLNDANEMLDCAEKSRSNSIYTKALEKYLDIVSDIKFHYPDNWTSIIDIENMFAQMNKAKIKLKKSRNMKLKNKFNKLNSSLFQTGDDGGKWAGELSEKLEHQNKIVSIKEWFENLEKTLMIPISTSSEKGPRMNRKRTLLFWESLNQGNPSNIPLSFTLKEESTSWNILDGWRRLLTIFIGIAVIRDMVRESDSNNPHIDKIQKRYFWKNNFKTVTKIKFSDSNEMRCFDYLYNGPLPLDNKELTQRNFIGQTYWALREVMFAEIETMRAEDKVEALLLRILEKISECKIILIHFSDNEDDD